MRAFLAIDGLVKKDEILEIIPFRLCVFQRPGNFKHALLGEVLLSVYHVVQESLITKTRSGRENVIGESGVPLLLLPVAISQVGPVVCVVEHVRHRFYSFQVVVNLYTIIYLFFEEPTSKSDIFRFLWETV